MARTLSWGVTPPDQARQGLVIEPAPTVELRTGDDQVLDPGEGQATIRREDGGPLGGTLSQPLVGGIATFDDLTIPDPGPRKLIAEVDTSSLVYPGYDPSDPSVVMLWRAVEEGGLGTMVDLGPLQQTADTQEGTRLPPGESPLGLSCQFSPRGNPVLRGSADGSEYRERMFGDMTVCVLMRPLPPGDLEEGYYDVISSDETSTSSGRLIVAYVRHMGGELTARYYWSHLSGAAEGPAAAPIPADSWVRLTVVRRATGSTRCSAVTYANGQAIASASDLDLPRDSSGVGHRFRIGRSERAIGNGFRGEVAEVVVLDRALSEGEVFDDALRCGVIT